MQQLLETFCFNAWMRRCLNGRNVARIRSKELAERFVTDAYGMKWDQTFLTVDERLLEELANFQKEHLCPKHENAMTT